MVKVLLVVIALLLNFCGGQNVKNGDGLLQAERELSNYLHKIDSNPVIPVMGETIVLRRRALSISNASQQPEEDLFDRCAKFLAERELTIKLPQNEARELLSDGRSKKLRRAILPILLLLKLKAAIILPIILSIIALVSFKGFGLSLAALAVAGTTALKSLLEHAHSKVSYEVVPTSLGHWSRAGATAENAVPIIYQ